MAYDTASAADDMTARTICEMLRTVPYLAIFLAFFVVVGLCHGENAANLIFKLIDGLRRDHAIGACQFVMEVD